VKIYYTIAALKKLPSLPFLFHDFHHCNHAHCYRKCWPKLLLTKQTFDLYFYSFLWQKILSLIYIMFIYGQEFTIGTKSSNPDILRFIAGILRFSMVTALYLDFLQFPSISHWTNYLLLESWFVHLFIVITFNLLVFVVFFPFWDKVGKYGKNSPFAVFSFEAGSRPNCRLLLFLSRLLCCQKKKMYVAIFPALIKMSSFDFLNFNCGFMSELFHFRRLFTLTDSIY